MLGVLGGDPLLRHRARLAAAHRRRLRRVDQQHGAVDPTRDAGHAAGRSSAGGAAGLVRVPRNDPWLIGHPLDLGALGVIVPMVESGEEAARAVAACRYAPEGERSIGLLRGAAGAAASRRSAS